MVIDDEVKEMKEAKTKVKAATAENVEEPIIVEDTKTEERSEVEELTEEVKRLNNLYLRTLADTENFKKRINEERIRERKYGAQRIFERLINVIDIFERALNVEVEEPQLKSFLTGFQMVNQQLLEIVEDEGVKKINAINEKFNPSHHHAMEVDYDESVEEDIVVEVFQNGYMYKDRVLRPALVKVNKKKTEGNNNE